MGPEISRNDLGVNVWLCISTAVLLYCTQVENRGNTRIYIACNYLPSEVAPDNRREQHINKNISWTEGTLLSQLCQRCDCEMENMVSPLQKFTRTHWASVSQAQLTRCDIRLPVVSSGSWNSILHFISALTVNFVLLFFPFFQLSRKTVTHDSARLLMKFCLFVFLARLNRDKSDDCRKEGKTNSQPYLLWGGGNIK